MNNLLWYNFGLINRSSFISTWKTDNTSGGSSTSTQIKLPLDSIETYNFVVNWGDGNSSTITAYNDIDITHTYASIGTYVVEIRGTCPKFYFNQSGDRLKILSIDQWGDVGYSLNQSNAFRGCGNLISIADDIEWINNVTNGTYMFSQTSFTSLPDGMLLSSLINGSNMFYLSSLTSLPSGMTLSNLTNGYFMFLQSTGLTSLPTGMLLSNLTSGSNMFNQTSLTSLPSGMTLSNLTDGTGMFSQIPLTSLPTGMLLSNLTNGDGMFLFTSSLTSLPSGMTLSNLTNGSQMFQGVTLAKARYSQLLVDMNTNNSNTGVTFHGGNSKYNTTGQTARNALTSRSPAWVITDGGFEP